MWVDFQEPTRRYALSESLALVVMEKFLNLKGNAVKRISLRHIVVGIVFVGAISVLAQAQSSTPLMDRRAYVGAFIGGNTGGIQVGNTGTVSAFGSNNAQSGTNLKETGGAAGGFEMGYYAHYFGAEINDVVAGWTTQDEPNTTGTRNVFLLNALGRIPISASWGMWYPYMGIGMGLDGGSAQNPDLSTLTENPRLAGDLKLGVAWVWPNGFGLFLEDQSILAGMNLSGTIPTQYGPETITMTGTSINGVLDIGASYTFKL